MSGQPSTYWVVACSAAEQGRENIYAVLKSRVVDTRLCSDSSIFEVPLHLKFGSFDELMRLVDDLVKYDSQIELIIRKMERHALEMDPNAELKVIWQRNSMTVDQYLRRFMWDDAKYPKTRTVRENVDLLIQYVQKLDDELRGKTAAFNEVKQSHTAASKKGSMSFIQRDLCDVLTPEVVSESDFVYTEHLCTLVVIIPKSLKDIWLSTYESLQTNVVPRSAMSFDMTDMEGNEIWRVIVFRSGVEDFKMAARNKRFIVREFTYSRDVYRSKIEQRTLLEAEKTRQEAFLSRVCFAAFSDAFIAWVHLKAMRVFVEAVLRFGVPPSFSAFFLKPTVGNKTHKLRKELNDVFTTKGMFGKSYVDGVGPASSSHDTTAGAEGLDEEYYPYVSLELTPLALAHTEVRDKRTSAPWKMFETTMQTLTKSGD